jgi:hypothetical protein
MISTRFFINVFTRYVSKLLLLHTKIIPVIEIKQKITEFAGMANGSKKNCGSISSRGPFHLVLESNACTLQLIQLRWQDELCA